MKYFRFLIVLFFINNVNCIATGSYPIGARSAALSDASVTYSDIWCSFNNQAGLAKLKGCTAGVDYVNRFLLPEFSTRSFAVALPTKNSGVFALSSLMF